MSKDIQAGTCGTKEGYDGDQSITLDIPGGDSFAGARVVCPHLQGHDCTITNRMCEIAATLRELRIPGIGL